MDATDASEETPGSGATAGSAMVGDQPLGPDAVSILASESWSLLATRSMWNDRISRTTIFLTVLSAAVVALALVANATGFGPTTRAVALVLLPVVLLIGLATFVRLVEIGNEDMRLVLAMNRVRHGYLTIAPRLQPSFSTGHHDDRQGLRASLLVAGPHDLHPWVHFLITAPTLVATVDAAIASVVMVLLLQATAAPAVAVVAGGAVAFLVVWGALFALNARTVRTLQATAPRFPTPAEDA
jgi:hypothetical protein